MDNHMDSIKTEDVIKDSNNAISQIAVSELFDGRYFFIPSYQRGYRWGRKQIVDLCNDLLEYALKAKPAEGVKPFYSLQPLIVRKGFFKINGEEKMAYEVIDGQQRLTSIMILYRYLLKENNIRSSEEYTRRMDGSKLYHIYYETRPDDFLPIEKLGFHDLTNDDIKDIDIAHVHNAYKYIDNWLYPSEGEKMTAKDTFQLLNTKDKYNAITVTTKLFQLLNNTKETEDPTGNVQFIWYELNDSKDAIAEFLSENKGKIKLTETEMIRALFMQRKEKNESSSQKQLSIAKDWEMIENTLHRNDFWGFIGTDFFQEDGRIRILFDYLYETDNGTSVSNRGPEDDDLYRYYYNKLNRTSTDEESAKAIHDLWERVMECFRMITNWYNNPRIYNLVGILTNSKTTSLSIRKIQDIFDQKNVTTIDNFIDELNREIRRKLVDSFKISSPEPKKDEDLGMTSEYLRLFYGSDNGAIYDLLLFINVLQLNKTIDSALKEIDRPDEEKKKSDQNRSARDIMSSIYRFPFDALDTYGWDIEHIDSATTNSLKDPAQMYRWIKEALSIDKVKELLLKEDSFKKLYDIYEDIDPKIKDDINNKQDTLHEIVKSIYRLVEEDDSELCKNWIGNLTLLDSGTNRGYKNMIFAWKNTFLTKRIRHGVFVPVCTQNVFRKEFANTSDAKWKWNLEDKKAYHNFLLKEIKDFKEKYRDQESESVNENKEQ